MEHTSITSYALATMCRLCLSRGDVTMFDLFSFSPRFKNRVADVIMKCAPVRILKRDEMPKFICRLCHTQLEKIHQFQMQIIQSDKTLRRYLKQLHAFDKKSKPQSPSKNSVIDNISADISVKCESLTHDVSKTKDDNVFLKFKIKEEPIDYNSKNGPDCVDGTGGTLSKVDEDSDINIEDNKWVEDVDVNSKLEVSVNLDCKINQEMSLTYNIKHEPMDDKSLILAESVEDAVNDSSNDCSRQIDCEDANVGIGHTSRNTACNRSTDVEENFERCEEKNTSGKRVHTEEKQYQCDVCNKCFIKPNNLKVHKRIHTGEKPYQCDVCSKYFVRSGDLKLHMRIHSGERPYQCDVCNKSFIQSSKLKVHKRIHTGEKPYQCEVCNKYFTQAGTLYKHRTLHTGDKSYKCDV